MGVKERIKSDRLLLTMLVGFAIVVLGYLGVYFSKSMLFVVIAIIGGFLFPFNPILV